MIEFNCPKCATRVQLADTAAGCAVNCITCGEELRVPGERERPQPPPLRPLARRIFVNDWRLWLPLGLVMVMLFAVAIGSCNSDQQPVVQQGLGIGKDELLRLLRINAGIDFWLEEKTFEDGEVYWIGGQKNPFLALQVNGDPDNLGASNMSIIDIHREEEKKRQQMNALVHFCRAFAEEWTEEEAADWLNECLSLRIADHRFEKTRLTRRGPIRFRCVFSRLDGHDMFTVLANDLHGDD